jgi:hypothetical protein
MLNILATVNTAIGFYFATTPVGATKSPEITMNCFIKAVYKKTAYDRKAKASDGVLSKAFSETRLYHGEQVAASK